MTRLWSLCSVLFVVLFSPYLVANPINVGIDFKSQQLLNVEYTLAPSTEQQILNNNQIEWLDSDGTSLNLGMNLLIRFMGAF